MASKLPRGRMVCSRVRVATACMSLFGAHLSHWKRRLTHARVRARASRHCNTCRVQRAIAR
eukprot:6984525-Alexandrium_andersonii.AAC.1